MRLATLRDGSRDGALIVVDSAAQTFASAKGIAASLQEALDDWSHAEPALRALSDSLTDGRAEARALDVASLAAPLPRAYEWIDGSAYLNHIRLVRKARNAALPPDLESDPIVYQGGSGVLLGSCDPLLLPDASWGMDFESEICVVLGDVPQGVSASEGAAHVRLLMLANDVTFRNLIPAELAKGFGFFVSKPATAFSPFAVTPDELGAAFRGGRAYMRLRTQLNGETVGDVDTGPEMHFSFFDLLAYVTRSRALTSGTILGSGTVSNQDRARGISCLVERRMIEIIERGSARTPYLAAGDRIEIEAFLEAAPTSSVAAPGRSVFGAIRQTVVDGLSSASSPKGSL